MTCYRYNKLTHRKEQVQCPYCGSTNVLKIVYGLPSGDNIGAELAANNEICGGCCVSDLQYYCVDCKESFNIIDMPAGTDYADRLSKKELTEPLQVVKTNSQTTTVAATSPQASLFHRAVVGLVYLVILYFIVRYIGFDKVETELTKLLEIGMELLQKVK